MARVLFLIALIVVLYIVIKRFSAYLRNGQQPQQPLQTGEEKIVQCAICGTHIPQNESMQQDTKTVCKQQPCKP